MAEKDSGNIHIIKGNSKGDIYNTIKIEQCAVTSLKYNELFNTVISVDSSGMIQYWDPDTNFSKIYLLILNI